MSYTRTYSGSVYCSGTERYPASQHGGTVSWSHNEPVHITIYVDTDAFDSSVSSCENSVDVLTTSVVATKAAQIAEIKSSADKVSSSIIKGFFSTVSSEISQQIAALENEKNSTLLHLTQIAKKVIALKTQMEGDYHRITERYVKVFEDLNNELENRILHLDSKIFEFEKIAAENINRIFGSDLSTTVSVFGKENASLSARISSGSAKEKALIAINKAKEFLFVRNKMNQTIKDATISEAKEKVFYVPSCFMETHDKNTSVNDNLKENVADKFKSDNLNWEQISETERKYISIQLNGYINEAYNSTEPKVKRVRDTLQKLVNLQGVQICRN
ncbi:MAG: hypothetical protein FWC26_13255 [Fibromonadales bacterium]|nr:hypothetical protein [Fibromonadales bacterium]